MAKTVTVDSLSLLDVTVVQSAPGQVSVNAIYNLLAGTQVIATLNQDVTTLLDPATLSSVSAALGVVQSALLATQA